jgi:hypothetical protein
MRPDKLPRQLINPLDRLSAAWRLDRGIAAAPSQLSKRRHLLALFNERRHDMLIETGTYLGETVRFFLPHATKIVSIEVDPALHARAARMFSDRQNVEIVLGDALDIAPRLISELDHPCLLWLDGHFSGGVTGRGAVDEPVVEILRRIHPDAVVPGTTAVIDDVRLFGTNPGVPSLESLLEAARRAFPQAHITVELDTLVVRVT